ncbi:hypothetical protein FGO68_gene15766 [Halteria grandinella]|uniref:Uncharacterized protein n=1 Tax=Halteria grandinella TaxID=5974 RepID=A0A8J8T723_HALGN|nr:hypothetical protein FGO68_gene15766 [Halteria grandinella]
MFGEQTTHSHMKFNQGKIKSIFYHLSSIKINPSVIMEYFLIKCTMLGNTFKFKITQCQTSPSLRSAATASTLTQKLLGAFPARQVNCYTWRELPDDQAREQYWSKFNELTPMLLFQNQGKQMLSDQSRGIFISMQWAALIVFMMITNV